MRLKFKNRFCNHLWVLVHYENLIHYFEDQHILKDLGNKQKNHSKHLVGPTIEVEVPPVTGCSAWTLWTKAEVFFGDFHAWYLVALGKFLINTWGLAIYNVLYWILSLDRIFCRGEGTGLPFGRNKILPNLCESIADAKLVLFCSFNNKLNQANHTCAFVNELFWLIVLLEHSQKFILSLCLQILGEKKIRDRGNGGNGD